MALNLNLVALTTQKRPVHALNDHGKTRPVRRDDPAKMPQERTRPNRRRAATGEDTHDIWTG